MLGDEATSTIMVPPRVRTDEVKSSVEEMALPGRTAPLSAREMLTPRGVVTAAEDWADAR